MVSRLEETAVESNFHRAEYHRNYVCDRNRDTRETRFNFVSRAIAPRLCKKGSFARSYPLVVIVRMCVLLSRSREARDSTPGRSPPVIGRLLRENPGGEL